MSSPKLNTVILAGCVLTYMSVFFQDVTHQQGSILCKLYTGFLTIGFSLAFGALFAKTWRVHVIFMTKITTKRKKIKEHSYFLYTRSVFWLFIILASGILKDSHLLFMVCGIAAIQIVILVVWELLDSQIILSRALPDLTFEDGEIIVKRSLLQCASKYSYEFRGVIYVMQGGLLIFGAFLAWETRTVKIAALNDSKYIGVSIYNVMILSVFSVGASFVLESQVTLEFAVISTCTILGTTITQCVIFIPKVISNKEQQIFPTIDGMTETIQTTNNFKEPKLVDQLNEKQARIQSLEHQLSLYAKKDSESEQQKA